jgi:hypothetical protein
MAAESTGRRGGGPIPAQAGDGPARRAARRASAADRIRAEPGGLPPRRGGRDPEAPGVGLLGLLPESGLAEGVRRRGVPLGGPAVVHGGVELLGSSRVDPLEEPRPEEVGGPDEDAIPGHPREELAEAAVGLLVEVPDVAEAPGVVLVDLAVEEVVLDALLVDELLPEGVVLLLQRGELVVDDRDVVVEPVRGVGGAEEVVGDLAEQRDLPVPQILQGAEVDEGGEVVGGEAQAGALRLVAVGEALHAALVLLEDAEEALPGGVEAPDEQPAARLRIGGEGPHDGPSPPGPVRTRAHVPQRAAANRRT